MKLKIFMSPRLALDGEENQPKLWVGAEEEKASGEAAREGAAERMPEGQGSDRKAAIRRGLIVFFCALLVGGVLGFGIMSIVIGVGNRRDKDFTVADMTITLDGSFTRQSYPGTLAAFGSRNVALFIRNIDLNKENSLLSEKYYAMTIIAESGHADAEVLEDDGLCYFILPYTNEGGARLLHYIYVLKTDSDFWVLQFDIAESKEGRLAPKISKWVHSIRFE